MADEVAVEPVSGPVGRTIARKVALRAALVMSLPLAAVVVLAWLTARAELDRTADREARRRLEDWRATVVAAGLRPAAELERLETHLRRSEPRVIEAWLAGDPGGEGTLERLASQHRLDRLDVISGGRTIASTAAWRVGTAAPPQAAPVRWIRNDDDPAGSWEARREIAVGSRRLELAAAAAVADIAGASPRWLRPGADAVWIGAREPSLPLDEVSPEASVDTSAASGERWRVASAAIEPAGWGIAVALSREPDRELLARLGSRLAGLAGGALLLVLVGGVWAASPLARRVRELTAAVQRVRAGEADYTFPDGGGDELDALVAAFSALHRDLQRQRDRSVAAERVAAWREVARRVAHEVKNPLAPIRLTVQNLQRARRGAPEAFDRLFDEGAGTILEEVEQLSRLVGEFSEFARLPAPRLAGQDVVQLVRGAVELFAGEPGLEAATRFPDTPLFAEVDGEQLGRALKNVIGNAVEAMRELPPDRPRRLEVRVSAGDEQVLIEVADSGPGMEPDTRARVFEPYFTTKNEGTGLGMAITYRIIVEHGGEIDLDSTPGRGTRATIRLPRRTETGESHATHPDRR